MSSTLAAFLLALSSSAFQPPDPLSEHIASTPPRTPEEERKLLHLPPGFEIQLVAAEPDIHKPLNIAFDDRGRLWVTDTVEYPFPAFGLRRPRDTIKVLEDFGPDGRARKITTFADGLNIPIGILPLPASGKQTVLAFNIPNIWQFRDTKGTGRADQREVLIGAVGQRDTHGMTNAFVLGLDDWVYACHGFANHSIIQGRDGQSITMESGNTYRFRPDGSHVEHVTFGQVNPFGLCFDPRGYLYSADCHSRPLYQLIREAYYPSFGKPHDGLGFGPEMVNHDHGSTAIAGITWYAADQFPPEYHGTMFVGNVVTNRINHDKLEWHGSSPRGIEQPDFLRSDDRWFRPVDIKIGPDGALYVADFYNRIIGHYEVPLDHPGRDRERGRIWRISYHGNPQATPAPRSDWSEATSAELVDDLGHPNITVRMLATHQLIARGAEAARAVRELLIGKAAPTATQWAHGLWVLEHAGKLNSSDLDAAIKHADPLVRIHAQRILAERSEWAGNVRDKVLAALRDGDPHVRRAAVEALGRHPQAANVRPLLDVRHTVSIDDTHLLHTVRIALRDQLIPAATWPALAREKWDERDRRAIADVSLGVPTPESADYLLHYLRKYTEPRERLGDMVHHIARYGSPATVTGGFELLRGHQPNDLGLAAELFRAFDHGTQERGGKLDPAVRSWGVSLVDRLLGQQAPAMVQAGIDLAASLRLTTIGDRLAAIAGSRSAEEGSRRAAINALLVFDNVRNAAVVGRVLADPAAPLAVREHAVAKLAEANQPATREQLLQALPTVPARVQNTIAAGLAGSREGAEKLLEAVAAGKASARLLQERAVAVRLELAHLPNLKERLEKLTVGLPRPDERIQATIDRKRSSFLAAKTEIAAGKRVFTQHCALCHQIGGEGARIGPQLDGIGIRGLDRLLEDILDPNRNVDQAFRTTTLELNKGQVISGLLLREEGAILVLADSQGKEVRVAKSSVAERFTSQVSPMPADLVEKVPEADLNNLLAYLLAQRPKPDAVSPSKERGGKGAP
jgi:putative heme-binding domain-containing protein